MHVCRVDGDGYFLLLSKILYIHQQNANIFLEQPPRFRIGKKWLHSAHYKDMNKIILARSLL